MQVRFHDFSNTCTIGSQRTRTVWFRESKLRCVVRMVVDSILPHAENGPNDHPKDAPPFIIQNESITCQRRTFLTNEKHPKKLTEKLNDFCSSFFQRMFETFSIYEEIDDILENSCPRALSSLGHIHFSPPKLNSFNSWNEFTVMNFRSPFWSFIESIWSNALMTHSECAIFSI